VMLDANRPAPRITLITAARMRAESAPKASRIESIRTSLTKTIGLGGGVCASKTSGNRLANTAERRTLETLPRVRSRKQNTDKAIMMLLGVLHSFPAPDRAIVRVYDVTDTHETALVQNAR
jgi:hypothetical protein